MEVLSPIFCRPNVETKALCFSASDAQSLAAPFSGCCSCILGLYQNLYCFSGSWEATVLLLHVYCVRMDLVPNPPILRENKSSIWNKSLVLALIFVAFLLIITIDLKCIEVLLEFYHQQPINLDFIGSSRT